MLTAHGEGGAEGLRCVQPRATRHRWKMVAPSPRVASNIFLLLAASEPEEMRRPMPKSKRARRDVRPTKGDEAYHTLPRIPVSVSQMDNYSPKPRPVKRHLSRPPPRPQRAGNVTAFTNTAFSILAAFATCPFRGLWLPLHPDPRNRMTSGADAPAPFQACIVPRGPPKFGRRDGCAGGEREEGNGGLRSLRGCLYLIFQVYRREDCTSIC
ncbi:hypothetical protein FPV67DRAFT_1488898 [Lyophyllum atratum]|nr:hypothetical protein FPV67DRAFT_1488898 [Lyophyllum atratum]